MIIRDDVISDVIRPGVTGSAYRRAEFTRWCYCACATYLHVKLVHVAHVRWAQITKRAYFTHVVNRKLTQESRIQ